MDLSKIRHLRSKDLLTLVLYSFAGLFIPITLFVFVLLLLGVPLNINNQEYVGTDAILFSILFLPISTLFGAIVFWVYLAVGWKLIRIIIPYLGFGFSGKRAK